MTIGGVAATEVSVVSGGSITGKTGPHAAGAADVVVTQGWPERAACERVHIRALAPRP